MVFDTRPGASHFPSHCCIPAPPSRIAVSTTLQAPCLRSLASPAQKGRWQHRGADEATRTDRGHGTARPLRIGWWWRLANLRFDSNCRVMRSFPATFKALFRLTPRIYASQTSITQRKSKEGWHSGRYRSARTHVANQWTS